MRNYADWARETPAEETRDGQEASYERWVGKHMARPRSRNITARGAAHHGNEIITQQSVRRFASQLAEAQTEIVA
jgi:hypothetical protein